MRAAARAVSRRNAQYTLSATTAPKTSCYASSNVINTVTPTVGPSFVIQRPISTSLSRHKDPWMLPNTPEHLASTETPPDLPPPKPLDRPNETVETMRARLVYQSRKRGTLESDLLLSTFARDNLSRMDEKELGEYDRLLDEPDWDIYYWSTGKRTPPSRWANSAILEKLRVHARNEGKVVRQMPPL